jgi:hypothetical protein
MPPEWLPYGAASQWSALISWFCGTRSVQRVERDVDGVRERLPQQLLDLVPLGLGESSE